MNTVAQIIITIAAVLTALIAIFGFIFAVYRFYLKQGQQGKCIEDLKINTSEEIKNIKKEQAVMCYGMLASLDGLKQLGCNGEVTKAKDALEKHLNLSAHE